MRTTSLSLRNILAVGALAASALTLAPSAVYAAPAPVSTLTSTACPAAIQSGQTSGCVTRLQNLLNSKDHANLVVDGVFGNATLQAVKKWQAEHGLAVDGIVGINTKRSLENSGSTSTSTKNQKVVSTVTAVMSGYKYPYVLGGGHGANPGPSNGGLDCSGFARWVYAKAYGYDVLGSGSAAQQSYKGTITTNPQPGDLVFYSSGGIHTAHHVAIYLGGGRIAHEPNVGRAMEYSTIAASTYKSDNVYYVHVG